MLMPTDIQPFSPSQCTGRLRRTIELCSRLTHTNDLVRVSCPERLADANELLHGLVVGCLAIALACDFEISATVLLELVLVVVPVRLGQVNNKTKLPSLRVSQIANERFGLE